MPADGPRRGGVAVRAGVGAVIAKITRGADPGRIGAYLHGPGRAEEHVYEGRLGGAVIAGTVPVLEPRAAGEWVGEMRAAIARRADITRPVWQASLRSAPGDRAMSDGEWADAAQGFAMSMGFAGHPWVAVRHGADHVHVVVSRVDHAGEVWHGRFDRRLAQQACAQLETEHGLRQAPRSRAVPVAPGQQHVVGGGPADGQLTKGEWRRAVASDTTPTRVVLVERVRAAAGLAAGRGRAAFEAELTAVGVAYQANEAGTGRMNGYRFADPTHRDELGEPVWFKASQLDKTLSWAALNRRLTEPPLPTGRAPAKRRLQTRTSHDRDLAAAHQAAGADRDRAADQARAAAHARLGAEERGWAQTWTARGTATPGKTDADRTSRLGGITPTVGDTVDPAALVEAVDQRRRDRLTAQVLTRPAPGPSAGPRPGTGRDTGPASSRSPYQAPDRDRDRGVGR